MPKHSKIINWIRELSPSAKREIVVIIVILIVSIALSLPQFMEDCKVAAGHNNEPKNEQGVNSAAQGIDISGSKTGMLPHR